jgi:hypothetical protein
VFWFPSAGVRPGAPPPYTVLASCSEREIGEERPRLGPHDDLNDDPFGRYIDGTCSGSGSTPGGATVVLQRLRHDGAVLADVHRVRCGPVELTSVFGDKVTLEAGLHPLAIDKNTGGLDVRLEPTATLN